MHMLDANKLGALGTIVADRTRMALGGLSPSAAALLSLLHFKPGLTATRLAEIAEVSQPTAVRLIDGLEREALITRGKPQGRVTPLLLTEAGRERAAHLQQRRLAALEGLLSSLAPKDRRQFALTLDRILAGATTSRASAHTACRLCEHDLCGPEVCPIGRRADEIDQRIARHSVRDEQGDMR
jgi:DNA-binding MarR family transcriptional regulator